MNKFNTTFGDFLNEAKSTKVDYKKKFGKKVAEINELINKAKKDGIAAVDNSGTVESEYVFDKVVLTKTQLKTYYKEGIPGKKQIDIIKLALDKDNDFEEARYLFNWIKKTIKKGYKEDGKHAENDRKEEEKRDKELEKEEKKNKKVVESYEDFNTPEDDQKTPTKTTTDWSKEDITSAKKKYSKDGIDTSSLTDDEFDTMMFDYTHSKKEDK